MIGLSGVSGMIGLSGLSGVSGVSGVSGRRGLSGRGRLQRGSCGSPGGAPGGAPFDGVGAAGVRASRSRARALAAWAAR